MWNVYWGQQHKKALVDIRKLDSVSGTKKFQNVAQTTKKELDTPQCSVYNKKYRKRKKDFRGTMTSSQRCPSPKIQIALDTARK